MKITVSDLMANKRIQRRIAMLTAYDCPSAGILDACGVDIVLVGDSVGTTVLGYGDITQVSIADMLHHARAVSRGITHAFILADMPYGSYRNPGDALNNASALIDAGVDGVKLEGGTDILAQVRALTGNGIAVCAHIGYMPQSGTKPGIVGKTPDEAGKLIDAALALEQEQAFMIVLELMPEPVAAEITNMLRIPTIGIGSGRFCDGQVQVFHDMLGLSPRIFRHVKDYAGAGRTFTHAISRYVEDVRSGSFPEKSNAVSLPEDVATQIRELAKSRTPHQQAIKRSGI